MRSTSTAASCAFFASVNGMMSLVSNSRYSTFPGSCGVNKGAGQVCWCEQCVASKAVGDLYYAPGRQLGSQAGMRVGGCTSRHTGAANATMTQLAGTASTLPKVRRLHTVSGLRSSLGDSWRSACRLGPVTCSESEGTDSQVIYQQLLKLGAGFGRQRIAPTQLGKGLAWVCTRVSVRAK